MWMVAQSNCGADQSKWRHRQSCEPIANIISNSKAKKTDMSEDDWRAERDLSFEDE